jgi:zinc protease
MKQITHVFLGIVVLFATVVLHVPAEGQRELSNAAEESALLPFHSDVVSDRLDNGLEYYLLEHQFPKETVVLRLVVDAGSVLETEAQLGLAHFVEHMAFNGTEVYDEDELVAYLERLGMQFGPDVNAYTSFDETVYKLEVPANDPEALETGFQVMQQWAHALTFEAEAIERERGVIVEEWRRGQSASQRVLRTHIPAILADSRYADRLPIGDMEIVRNAPREEFVSFYRDWYRPDNMALIVVGDLPTREMKRLVSTHFTGIDRPSAPLDRPYFDVPIPERTRVSIATDEELSRSTVSIYIPKEPKPLETERDYRELLVRSLFASIINDRIRELARDPDAPITGGGIGWSRFLRNTEIAVASGVVKNDAPEAALELLVREIERASRFGVLPEELDRAKRRFLQSIDQAKVNYGSRSSNSLADELVRYWTEGEAVPGIDEEYRIYNRFLPEITQSEVNAVAEEFSVTAEGDSTHRGGMGRIVLASLRVTPEQTLPNGDNIPTERSLLNAIENAANLTLRPWDEATVPDELVDPSTIRSGSIVSEVRHEAVEVTELQLSNGMRVFLKPTELREDEILFSAYSPGGLSLVPDELVTAAKIAPSVAEDSGIGDYDTATIEKILSGRSVQLRTGIGRVSESMSGSARQGDVESLLQLVHLAFTAPRFDAEQLSNVKRETIQSIEGMRSSPQGQFGRRFEELFADGEIRLRSPRVEEVEGVRLSDVETVYAERFADPADFALFFVGSFEVETMRSLAEKYLAGIGATSGAVAATDTAGSAAEGGATGDAVAATNAAGGAAEGGATSDAVAATNAAGGAAEGGATSDAVASAAEDQFAFRESVTAWELSRPTGVVSELIEAGSEPVGQYVALIHSPYEWSRETNHRFNSVADLLDIRLRERIREEAGGSYSIGAGGWRWRYPEPWAYTQISFGMDPARREELSAMALEVVEEVRTTLASEDYLERIKAQQRESYRQSLQENQYWLSTLQFYVQHRRDLATIPEFPELIESLTAEDIRETAQRFLDPQRRIELSLIPEP